MSWLQGLGRQGYRTETVDNGTSITKWRDGYLSTITYNTGDVLWISYSKENGYKVIIIETHEGNVISV